MLCSCIGIIYSYAGGKRFNRRCCKGRRIHGEKPRRTGAALPVCAISVYIQVSAQREPSRYEILPKSTSACDKLTDLLREDPVCDGTRLLLLQIAALLADCLIRFACRVSRKQSSRRRKICLLSVSRGVCVHTHICHRRSGMYPRNWLSKQSVSEPLLFAFDSMPLLLPPSCALSMHLVSLSRGSVMVRTEKTENKCSNMRSKIGSITSNLTRLVP